MKRRMIAGLFVLLLVSSPTFAQQRPLLTEDPETVGANRVLIEGGVEFDKDQGYPAYGLEGDTAHVATFGVSAGIGPTAEVQIDGGFFQRLQVSERKRAPLSAVLDFSGDRASSFEDFTVATKIRLGSEAQTRPAIGVRFGTKLPTAQREKGMGLGTTDFFAALLLGKTVQSVRTVANVGLLVLGNAAGAQEPVRALSFGLSVARAITNEFEVVGEVHGHMDPMGDATPPGTESRGVLRLGTRYTHHLLRFDAAVLVGVTSRDPTVGITAGATYVFGR
jgi:hypothetical protein